MQNRELLIIVVVGIWFFCIAVLGILALRFWRVHGKFNKFKIIQEDEFANEKANFVLDSINILYELPLNEKCFFKGSSSYFSEKKPRNRQLKRYEKKLNLSQNDSYDDDYYELADAGFKEIFWTEKQHYRITDKHFAKATYEGELYVTNNRILIEMTDSSYQMPISEIAEIYLTIVKYKGVYWKSVKMELKKHDRVIYLTYDDIKLYFAIKSLITDQKGDE